MPALAPSPSAQPCMNGVAAPRPLGLVSATAMVVANMIGAGVFTTSGYLLGDLKSPWIVLLAWAVGGLIAAAGASCYGALGRRIPESGGEYLFLSRTLHPAAGYLAGWVSLLVGFSAPLAATAIALNKYVGPWLPFESSKWLGTLLLVGFSLLHGLHVRHGARTQNLAVFVKVLGIVVFVLVAAGRMPDAPQAGAPAEFRLAPFAVSLVWIAFSYSGWNAAVYVAGEIRDAERTLPRALLLGTGLVTVLYLGLNAVFVFAAPPGELIGKEDVGRIAAAAIGGEPLALAVTALVALGLITSVSSMIMAGPRVYARMADDGYLPRWLRSTGGTPLAATAFQLALALLLLWTASFASLITCIGFTLSLSTAATVFGLVRLRQREGPALHVPGWPWLPWAFLLATLGMAVFAVTLKPRESGIGLATLAVGWLAWWFNERRHSAAKRQH